MGNFFVILAPEQRCAETQRWFQHGLQRAQHLRGQQPSHVIETDWARVATFARQNGSSVPLVRDEATGSWLLAVGTWFHTNGFAVGDEMRLLARAMEIGAARLAQELEGFFVVVFGDGRTQEVFVINDVMGSRHSFVRECEGVTALSGSSLLLGSLAAATPDPVGCEEFLRVGILYDNRTFFREVRKLAPATVLRYADGRLRETQQYWRMADLDPTALSGKRAVNELGEKLLQAVNRVGKVFKRPVCDLTGGYDSRSVVAAFLTAGVPFETTVSGFEGDPDVVISQSLSQLTGKRHHPFVPETRVSLDDLKQVLPLTDGEYDLVEYARICALHRKLMMRFDASINGSYGEVARGYCWLELLFPKTGRREPVDLRKLAARRYASDPCSPQLFPPGIGIDLVTHFAAHIAELNRELAGWPNTAQMDNAYLLMRMQRWQGRIASSTDQIWPCFSPFLFRSVLDVILQTDAATRKQSRLIRHLLFALQPQLAAHPLEHGHPAMPITLASLPRFAPALKHYAKKIERKLRPASDRKTSIGVESPRAQLWGDEAVREMLNPATMRLTALMDTQRLRAFFDHSQQAGFAFEQQWCRLLSLELTLQVLDD